MTHSPRQHMKDAPTRRPTTPTALRVGPADDTFEREADRAADAVTRGGLAPWINALPGDGGVRRKCDACAKEDDEGTLRRDAAGGDAGGWGAPPIVSDVLRSPGRPLEAGLRAEMERGFGHDFSRVRVHDDARAAESARAVSAHAYTVGSDVVFGEGRYSPTSQAGRRLLAHELAHTLQQGASSPGARAEASASPRVTLQRTNAPLVQRVACDLAHLDTECGAAASNCASIQASYCASKYPTPADIDALHANAIASATTYSAKYPNAGRNLLHFLSGTGAERVMPVAIFKNDSETADKLENEHRDRFIAGARRRLASGELTPGGGQVEMVWTGTASAFSYADFTDLGLAVGGYTLCSKVKVSAATSGSDVRMTFDEWTVQAFDCYNWDPGKGIGIPGADDNDLCCLENAGKAKHFRIRTDVWTNENTTATAPADLGRAPESGGGGGSGGGDRR